MKKIKAVFDTNIWVSYFIKGNFEELVSLVYDKDVEIFRSDKLTDELVKVLGRPKFRKYFTLPLYEYVAFYEALTTLVDVNSCIFKGCRDPKDNYLFDIARQAGAKYLVSGDNDIKETNTDGNPETISLHSFKELIK